jgi:hypothetical protein
MEQIVAAGFVTPQMSNPALNHSASIEKVTVSPLIGQAGSSAPDAGSQVLPPFLLLLYFDQ